MKVLDDYNREGYRQINFSKTQKIHPFVSRYCFRPTSKRTDPEISIVLSLDQVPTKIE
jgi:hypothetical protein